MELSGYLHVTAALDARAGPGASPTPAFHQPHLTTRLITSQRAARDSSCYRLRSSEVPALSTTSLWSLQRGCSGTQPLHSHEVRRVRGLTPKFIVMNPASSYNEPGKKMTYPSETHLPVSRGGSSATVSRSALATSAARRSHCPSLGSPGMELINVGSPRPKSPQVQPETRT
jgi:hypothetical protein